MKNFSDFGIDIPYGRHSGFVRLYCPQCHSQRQHHKREKSLSVNVEEGWWHCHHCGWSGNLLSLKNGTPTLVIEKRNAYNTIYDSKIRDFMRRIDMLDNCYFDDSFDFCSIKNKLEVLEKTDKLQLDRNLQQEAKSYYSFYESLKQLI